MYVAVGHGEVGYHERPWWVQPQRLLHHRLQVAHAAQVFLAHHFFPLVCAPPHLGLELGHYLGFAHQLSHCIVECNAVLLLDLDGQQNIDEVLIVIFLHRLACVPLDEVVQQVIPSFLVLRGLGRHHVQPCQAREIVIPVKST